MLVVDEMVEGVTEGGGIDDDVVGNEIDESPTSSEADVDERVAVVTVEREEAVVHKSLMPSGGNDEELVLDVAIEKRDEAATTVSVEVAARKNAHSSLSMIAPVMTHGASPSSCCLPVVIFRGSRKISQSNNLPSRLVDQECRRSRSRR